MPSELQFRVLRLLESNPNLSQRALSKSLGVSLGGVNYCLNVLIAKAAVKIQNLKTNQNKYVYIYAYLLTPQGISEKTAFTGSFLKRKMQEYEQLKQEIESLTHEAQIVGAAEIAVKISQEETSEGESRKTLINNNIQVVRYACARDRVMWHSRSPLSSLKILGGRHLHLRGIKAIYYDFRGSDVHNLLADLTKAKHRLGHLTKHLILSGAERFDELVCIENKLKFLLRLCFVNHC